MKKILLIAILLIPFLLVVIKVSTYKKPQTIEPKHLSDGTVLVAYTSASHTVNSLTNNVCLFDNNTKVVLPDKILGDSKYIVFVDLTTGKAQNLELPRAVDLFDLIPMEDKCILPIGKEIGIAYIVDKNGNIDQVQYFRTILGPKEKLEKAISAIRNVTRQNNSNFIEVQEKAYNLNAKDIEISRVRYLYNSKILISVASDSDLYKELESRIRKRIINDYTKFTDNLTYNGLRIKVNRLDYQRFAGGVTNQAIKEVLIANNEGETIKIIKPNVPYEFYYYIILQRNKLYLIGSQVIYVDLDNLSKQN